MSSSKSSSKKKKQPTDFESFEFGTNPETASHSEFYREDYKADLKKLSKKKKQPIDDRTLLNPHKRFRPEDESENESEDESGDESEDETEDTPSQFQFHKRWIKQLLESQFSTFDSVRTQAAKRCIGLKLQTKQPAGTKGIETPLTFELAMPMEMSVEQAGGMDKLNASFAEHALMQLIMDDSFPKKVVETETKAFNKFLTSVPKKPEKQNNYQFGMSAGLTERRACLTKCGVVVVGNTIIVTGDVCVDITEAKNARQLEFLKTRSTNIKMISSDVSFINGVPFYTDYVHNETHNTESIDVWIAGSPQHGNPIRLAELHRPTHGEKKEPWKLTIDTRGLERTDAHKTAYKGYLDFKETLPHAAWRCIEEMLRANYYNSEKEEVTMSAKQIQNFIQ